MGKISEVICTIVLGVIIAIVAENMNVSSNVNIGLMILTVIVTSNFFKFARRYSASKEKK